MKLILASASPRRRDLLAQAGFEFAVITGDIDESQREGENPVAYTSRLAAEKALAVFDALVETDDVFVVGADTTVAVDGVMLGKPVDVADAEYMLYRLQGRAHSVTTGVAVVAAKKSLVAAETTHVFFEPMSPDEISAYVATGEPMDKAGAYAIQGGAAPWITRIEGSYDNVVGLPVNLVREMLAKLEAR
jgi:septum formation protein